MKRVCMSKSKLFNKDLCHFLNTRRNIITTMRVYIVIKLF